MTLNTLQTNVSSLTSTRLLNITNRSLAKTTERLSSGLRINRAADDAAGLFTSEGLTAQIRGNQAAIGNIQQATALTQMADAGLASITDALQRMKELATAASSGLLSADQRNALNTEYVAVRDSITSIVNSTVFGGSSGLVLLNGSVGSVTLQVSAQTTGIATVAMNTNYSGASLVAQATISTQATAVTAQGQIDTALTTVGNGRAAVGAQTAALEYMKNSLEVGIVANSDARARIRDADVAAEVSNLVRGQILQQAGTSALSASNFSTQFVLSLLQ